VQLKRHKNVFGRGSAPNHTGELMTLPEPPSLLGRATPWLGRGHRLWRLDLAAFDASLSFFITPYGSPKTNTTVLLWRLDPHADGTTLYI